jgi:hypothetical protein
MNISNYKNELMLGVILLLLSSCYIGILGWGWLLLINAFCVAVYCIIIRFKRYPDRKVDIIRKYWCLIIIAIIGDIIALIGFIILSYAQSNPCNKYSSILTILALLSAGVIASFFAFSYRMAEHDEGLFTTFLAVGYKILFLLLFGSLSFYMGKSDIGWSEAEWSQITVPVIMGTILLTNTIFDFWDYREVDKDKQKGKSKGKEERGCGGDGCKN